MKKQNKIVLCLIGIAVVTIILLPLVINIAYKQNISIALLQTEWDASAALTYYGSLESAGIAVFGVFLTIRYSQKNYREDVRNRTLPYLAIDILKSSGCGSLDIQQPQYEKKNNKEYREYKVTDYYCIIQEGEIQYKTGLDNEQEQILKNAGIKYTPTENGAAYSDVNMISMPLEIENVGNGAAINFRLGLNVNEIKENERRFVTPFSLKVGEKIKIHVFSVGCVKGSPNLGDYVLGFYYEDIYENRYFQGIDMTIAFDESKRKSIVCVDADMAKRQIFVGGRNR